MPFLVIRPFFDRTDNMKPYKIGDSYTHEDGERVAFLVKEGFLEERRRAKVRKKPGGEKNGAVG
jgi:hypothetical protein